MIYNKFDLHEVSGFMQITLTQYDPSQSSTDEVLQCASADCVTASGGGEPTCTAAPTAEACAYSIVYGDGSSTSGYLINDVMTFSQVEDSTNTNGTASVYFGSVDSTTCVFT